MSMVLTSLLFMPLLALAGPTTAQVLGFNFDVPDGIAFREYPSIPGGRFIPAAQLENPYYHAVLRLEVFWDQWPELGTENFIKKWAVLSCAADGADSSQWCDEDSLTMEPFLGRSGIRGHTVRRKRTVETFSENGVEITEFTDLIAVFDLKDQLEGQNRLAAFVCEDNSCFDLVGAIGKSFRVH